MRRGEILSLKWSDIDLKRNFININNTKTGYARSIQINDNVRVVFENLDIVDNKASNY